MDDIPQPPKKPQQIKWYDPRYTVGAREGDLTEYQKGLLRLHLPLNYKRPDVSRITYERQRGRYLQGPGELLYFEHRLPGYIWHERIGYQPSYWEQPQRIARYYHVLQALPPDAETPPWLDREEIKFAYDYLKQKNNGAPWWQWKFLNAADPGRQFLQNIPQPPDDALWPGEELYRQLPAIQAGEYQPAEYETLAQPAMGGMTEEQYKHLLWWQKAMVWMGGNAPWLQPGLMAGTIGLIAGGGPLTPSGWMAGAAGFTLGSGLGALAVPEEERAAHPIRAAITDALMYLDYPTEWFERALGTLIMGYYRGGKEWRRGGFIAGANAVAEILNNLPAAFKAAHMTYESGISPLAPRETVRRLVFPTAPMKAWSITEPEPAIIPGEKAGAEALYEAFRRISSGNETPQEVWDDMSLRFGLSGQARELLGHMALDPLNVIGALGVATEFAAAKKTKNVALLTALAKSTGTDPIRVLRTYGAILRSSYPTSEIAKMGSFSRWLGGVDAAGKATDIAKKGGKGIFNYLFSLTPESRATEVVNNTSKVVGALMDRARDANGEFDHLQAAKMIHGMAEFPVNTARALSMQSLGAPDAAAIPLVMKDSAKVIDNIAAAYEAARQYRIPALEALEKITGRNREQIVLELADEAGARRLLIELQNLATKSVDPNAKELLANLQGQYPGVTGWEKLDAETLVDLAKPFQGKDGIPYRPKMVRAQMQSAIEELTAQWAADWFGVKPDPGWVRMSNVVKAAQSMVLLGFNPTYFLNNSINNIITMASEGVFGLRTSADIARIWDRVGILPPRLRAGIGVDASGLEQAHRLIRRAQAGTGALEDVRHTLERSRKWQVFGRLSAWSERASSVQAQTSGFVQFMSRVWQKDIGFSSMNPALEERLKAIHPDLPKAIYGSIQESWNQAEIEKKIWMGLNRMSVGAAIPEIAKRTGLSEADVSEALNLVGATSPEFADKLAKAKDSVEVSRLLDGIEQKAKIHLDELTNANLEIEARKAANRVAGEGVQAALEIFDQMSFDYSEHWFNHWVHMHETAQIAERIGAQLGLEARGLVWDNALADAARGWERLNRRQEAQMTGIIQGLGLDSETGRRMSAYLASDTPIPGLQTPGMHKIWANFYEYRRQQYAAMRRGEVTWTKVSENLYNAYEKAYADQEKVLDAMDAEIVQLATNQIGEEAGRAAASWREKIKSIRAKMHTDMVEHRAMGAQTWKEFLESNYFQGIEDLFTQNLEGARELWRAATQGNEPPPGPAMPRQPELVDIDWKLGGNQINPPEPATAPVMITNKMRQQLLDLGYSTDQMHEMTPQQAWDAIHAGKNVNVKRAEIRKIAAELAPEQLSTATPEGDVRNVDPFIRNVINKYSGQKYNDLAEIDPEIARTAIKKWITKGAEEAAPAGEPETIQAPKLIEYLEKKVINKARAEYSLDNLSSLMDDLVVIEHRIFDHYGGLESAPKDVLDTLAKAYDEVLKRYEELDAIENPPKPDPYIEQQVQLMEAGKVAQAGMVDNLERAIPPEERRINLELRAEIDRLQAEVKQLKIDPLTQAPVYMMDRAMVDAAPAKMVLDVTGLKYLNDTYGEAAGDALLTTIANTAREQGLDIHRVNMGGDEFIIPFESVEAAQAALDPLRQAVANAPVTFVHNGEQISLTGFPIHIGIGDTFGTAYDAVNDAKRAYKAGLTPEEAARGAMPPSVHPTEPGVLFDMRPQPSGEALQIGQIRQTLKQYLISLFPGGETGIEDADKQADAVLALLDAQANAWAKRTGKTPLDWYQTRIARAERLIDAVEDGRAVLHALQSPDVSTLMQEVGYIFRRDLTPEDLAIAEKWAGVTDGTWQVKHEKKFAKGFELYLKEGKAPSAALQGVFEQFKAWVSQVYARMREYITGSEINDEMRGVYNRLLEEYPEAQEYNITTLTGRAKLQEGEEGYGGPLVQFEDGRRVPLEDNPPDAIKNPLGAVDSLHNEAPVHKIEEDGYNFYVQPVLDALRSYLLDPNNALPQEVTDLKAVLDPDTVRELRGYLHQVYGQQSDTKLAGIRVAEARRDAALLNYSRRYGFDNVLTAIYPYNFWYTRNALNWGLRVIDKPSWLANYFRLRSIGAGMLENEGYPQRLKNKMRIPFPWLPEWAGGGVYVDPLRQMFPFMQLAQPFERLADQNNLISRRAVFVLEGWGEDGTEDATQVSQAIKERTGPLWEKAVAQAQLEIDEEIENPIDFVNTIFGMNLPLNWLYQSLRGKADRIGPLPLTRTIKSISALAGANQGRGWNVEGPLRRALGLPEYDRYNDYRVDRTLANMAADGYIDPDLALRAMIERGTSQDPDVRAAFIEAERRVAQQGILGLVGGPFQADLFPEGEQRQRALKAEYSKAAAAWRAGDDDALTKFFDKYPEYEARLALFREPEQRLKGYLIGEVWDRYMALPDLHKRQVREQLGQLFEEAFLNKETRSYDSININTLAMWARQLGSDAIRQIREAPQGELELAEPGVTAAYQAYQDERDKRWPGIGSKLNLLYNLPPELQKQYRAQYPEIGEYESWRRGYLADHPEVIQYVIGEESRVKGASQEIQALYYQYLAQRDKQFPGVMELQSAYYDNGKPKGFLDANPMLPAYWEWRREFMRQYPEMIPYIMSTESLSKYVLGNEAAPSVEYAPIDTLTLTPAEMQEYSPALIRQLMAYYYSGQPLGAGAIKELMRLWQKSGRGGTFDEYLDGPVKKFMTATE